jgi:hypothetical protein
MRVWSFVSRRLLSSKTPRLRGPHEPDASPIRERQSGERKDQWYDGNRNFHHSLESP